MSANPMDAQRREQALANCRVLSGYEVELITFFSPAGYTHGAYNTNTWHAVILPKGYCISAALQGDINNQVFFKATSDNSSEYAVSKLLTTIEKRMGEILRVRLDGTFEVDNEKI